MTSTHDWHPLGVIAGSVLMLGVAGWLGLRSRTAVRATISIVVVVLLAITFLGTLADLTHNIGQSLPGDPTAQSGSLPRVCRDE
jgi:hypothetical protein